MKKLTLLIGIITVFQSCGPTPRQIQEQELKSNKSTIVGGQDYNNVTVTTVIHEGKYYVVSTYREGVCIIPRN